MRRRAALRRHFVFAHSAGAPASCGRQGALPASCRCLPAGRAWPQNSARVQRGHALRNSRRPRTRLGAIRFWRLSPCQGCALVAGCGRTARWRGPGGAKRGGSLSADWRSARESRESLQAQAGAGEGGAAGGALVIDAVGSGRRFLYFRLAVGQRTLSFVTRARLLGSGRGLIFCAVWFLFVLALF